MKRLLLLFIFSAFIFSGYANWPGSNAFYQVPSAPGEPNRFELKVYPNPAETGRITLEMKSGEMKEIRLINIAGKEVVTRDMEFGTPTYLLTFEGIPNGIYFIRVKTTDEKVFVKKLVVSTR